MVETGITGAPTERPAPQIIQGTGTLALAPPGEPRAGGSPGQGYQLNFIDTDISTIVSAVLGDGLNVPFLVDPQVKGTMTLQATRSLSRDEMLTALESALRVQGVAMIDVGGTYHIVPGKEATRRISSLQMPGQGTHGFAIYVVPLQYVGAEDMEKILQPFAPEGGIVRVDEARNLLLLAGTSQELTTLLGVVRTFDVDWLAGMSFGMFPLEYVDAKTLAGELTEVFASAKSPIAGVVRFVPLPRLNSIMVITPQAKYLKDVEEWIKRLDLGATTPGRRIYVYDVQNGKADDLAHSLSSILSIPYDSPGDNGRSSGTATSGFSAGLSGGGTGLSTGIGGAAGYAAPSSYAAPTGSGGIAIRAPSYSSSGSSAGAGSVGATANGQSGPTSLDSGALRIVPSQENNSLLILASPSEFAVIEAALKRLDVLPIQVLIEASIAEVTLTDDIQYGLQWAYQGGDGPITLSQSSSGAIGQQFPGFSYLYTGRTNIQAVLNAIESLTNVRVLSAPKLMVLNNREAQLQIGDQVPVTVQSSVATSGQNSPIVNSVQLLDTGVILRVTPRANKSGRVILEVDQEVSDASKTTSSGIDSPTIQQRKISTTVAVRDGETIALGGLILDSKSRGGSGVPFLRRIPLLGQLFGSTSRNDSRTELIVLITPRVVRSDRESADVMHDLQAEFRGLQHIAPGWSATPNPAASFASPAAVAPQGAPPSKEPHAGSDNAGDLPPTPR